MKNKEYLLNLGFFYCAIIPEEKKCYILNGKSVNNTDVQDFIDNKDLDYSKYPSTDFPYDEKESWTSYLEAQNPITYHSKEDLKEETFFEHLALKKYTDGLLVAIKDPEREKVKVYRKNMELLYR